MTPGQATAPARKSPKPSPEQREHILKYHLALTVENGAVVLKYLLQCDKKTCPVPSKLEVFQCKYPPCPPEAWQPLK